MTLLFDIKRISDQIPWYIILSTPHLNVPENN